MGCGLWKWWECKCKGVWLIFIFGNGSVSWVFLDFFESDFDRKPPKNLEVELLSVSDR